MVKVCRYYYNFVPRPLLSDTQSHITLSFRGMATARSSIQPARSPPGGRRGSRCAWQQGFRKSASTMVVTLP